MNTKDKTIAKNWVKMNKQI